MHIFSVSIFFSLSEKIVWSVEDVMLTTLEPSPDITIHGFNMLHATVHQCANAPVRKSLVFGH